MLIKSDWSAESTILGRAEQSNSLSGEEEGNLWLLEIIILLFLINLRSLPFECIAICVASTQRVTGQTQAVCARAIIQVEREDESLQITFAATFKMVDHLAEVIASFAGIPWMSNESV